MDEDIVKYLKILKEDSIDIELIKSYILKIKDMFEEFVENMERELTEDERLKQSLEKRLEHYLEEFLDAYRDELKFTPNRALTMALILNKYCSYKELTSLFKGNKHTFGKLVAKAKKAEEGEGSKEELEITLESEKQILISLREIIRGDPNISEKDLLEIIQKRKVKIAEYLKSELIKDIQDNVGFLNQYGRIDEYIRMANKKLREVGLDGILYQKRNPIPDEYGDGKGNWIRYDESKKAYVKYDENGNVINDGEDLSIYEQDIGVIDAFDEDYLKKLSVEDLYMMDLFYRCIYFAERLELAKTMYAMEKMGIWSTILEGKKFDIEQIDEDSIAECFDSQDEENQLIEEEILNIKNTAKDMTIQECMLVSKLRAKDFSIRSWGTVDYSEEDEQINVAIDNASFRGTVIIAVPKTVLMEFMDEDKLKLPKYKNEDKLDDRYSFIMGRLYIPATDFYKKYINSKYKENPSSSLYAGLAGKKTKKIQSEDENIR